MQTGICKNCGKEYDQLVRNENGVVVAKRPNYCGAECREIAKRRLQNERDRRMRNERRYMQIISKDDSTTGRNYSVSGRQCFFCPLLGSSCRERIMPPCRPVSPEHHVFQAAVTRQQVYG
jgi:hypothetical protein